MGCRQPLPRLRDCSQRSINGARALAPTTRILVMCKLAQRVANSTGKLLSQAVQLCLEERSVLKVGVANFEVQEGMKQRVQQRVTGCCRQRVRPERLWQAHNTGAWELPDTRGELPAWTHPPVWHRRRRCSWS